MLLKEQNSVALSPGQEKQYNLSRKKTLENYPEKLSYNQAFYLLKGFKKNYRYQKSFFSNIFPKVFFDKETIYVLFYNIL